MKREFRAPHPGPGTPNPEPRPRVVWMVLVAALLALTVAGPAYGETPDEASRRIAKKLQCPVCESVSVADSPSELATQMRGLIKSKVEDGETEQEIILFFVDRYGEQVLLEPPFRGLGLLVWLAPAALMAVALIVLSQVLRAWRRSAEVARSQNPAVAEQEVEADSYARRAREELDRLRSELRS